MGGASSVPGDTSGRGPGQVDMARAVAAAWLSQRGHLVPWLPVALGLGIGVYFLLPVEPGGVEWAAIAAVCLVCLGLSRLVADWLSPLVLGLGLVAAGMGLAGLRTHLVAEPVLSFRYYGPIEGRIVTVDRSASEAVRLLLDQVVLEDVAPERTPARVRVSLHGQQGWIEPQPGLTVILTGHLTPPPTPVEPGAFDFRRQAWFQGLGAVGYTRTPVLLRGGAEEGAGLWLNTLRQRLSAAVQARIPGDAGGYAAAVTTGDRAGLGREAADNMRDANLFHLVAISGMHMGMVVAFVFALVRSAVALVPPLALRVSSKKVAALVALPVAAFYLALAGRSIATERAFIMAVVALVAILLDRRVLTMRSVAVAALIVLLLRPESLVNAGFQMSFAAVVALIAAFHAVRPRPAERWRPLMPVLFLLFSSLVAGLATAPFAAANFNRVAHYGLIANLLAVPAMGLLVMPGAVLMAILAPLGLERPAAWVVEQGSRWILGVAEWIAGLEGSASSVVSPGPWVVPLLTFGGLMLCLWQGRGRWLGLAPMAVALALWSQTSRPALLVADSGGVIGLMTEEGRVISRPRGDAFAVENWLQHDGSPVSQEEAAARPGLEGAGQVVRARLDGQVVLSVRGVTPLAEMPACDGADFLILNVDDPAQSRPCEVYDSARLRRTGALAIDPGPKGPVTTTVAERAGDRPWTRASGPFPALDQ